MKRSITFDRDGLTLAGDLYTPDNFDENATYQAILVQGSGTSVKEQMPATYAQKFADQGFVALAFDYSHYGASDGQPRQLEKPDEKFADLKAAVTYLTEQPTVDGIGMVGVCTSASNGVQLAAEDLRLKGFATIAGFLVNEDLFVEMMGEEVVKARREQAAAAKKKYDETGESTVVTQYSETDPTASSYIPFEGAFDYYNNPERGNVPEWKNEADVQSYAYSMSFDSLAEAASITIPTMVVHSDDSAAPENAKALYEAVQGEKELVWSDGNHYDYYDSPKQMDNAVANVTRFFRTHLAA